MQKKLTCVISTASRGIGFEFTKHLLEADGKQNQVVALCRRTSEQLKVLQNVYKSRLIVIDNFHLDQQETIVAAAERVNKAISGVDLLINSAGILGDNDPTRPGPEKSIASIKKYAKNSFNTYITGLKAKKPWGCS